jgi:hypothetical protein
VGEVGVNGKREEECEKESSVFHARLDASDARAVRLLYSALHSHDSNDDDYRHDDYDGHAPVALSMIV